MVSKPKTKTGTTSEYDVDARRADGPKDRIREDAEHDPIDTETGEYAKRDSGRQKTR